MKQLKFVYIVIKDIGYKLFVGYNIVGKSFEKLWWLEFDYFQCRKYDVFPRKEKFHTMVGQNYSRAW